MNDHWSDTLGSGLEIDNGSAAAPVYCRRAWVLELVHVSEAVAGLSPGPACPDGLQFLWCFPAWTRACLSVRFCFEADLAAVAATLSRAHASSAEQPEVIVLHRLPAFFPALLEDLAVRFGAPIISSREWCEGWKRRFYDRVAAHLPQGKDECFELSELNRRLERLQ